MYTARILFTLAGIISIAFGIWHFFVPALWNWYGYMDSAATELRVAVQAINVFFSTSLILFGLMNALIVWLEKSPGVSMYIVGGATLVLWLLRVVMQIVYPQGSLNPALQYGMLAVFIFVFASYAAGYFLLLRFR